MKPVIQLFLASLFFMLVYGCSAITEPHSLAWLKTAEPRRDCEAAIARGDTRFYAVNGFASGMVVGVSQSGADRKLVKTHGVRTIAGTSDTSTSRLNLYASEYARTYNQILLKYLRGKSNNH